MRVFSVVLLILVGTVFMTGPADLMTMQNKSGTIIAKNEDVKEY